MTPQQWKSGRDKCRLMDRGDRGKCFPLMCAQAKRDEAYIYREEMSEGRNEALGTCCIVPNQVRPQPLYDLTVH